MKECYICGVSGENRPLFDAISESGIIKVCAKCLQEERLPVVSRPGTARPEANEYNVRNRLTKLSGFTGTTKPAVAGHSEDINLRKIVEKNVKEKIEKGLEENHGLIRNFHWIIMRVRRAKHLTQEQLAEAISVSYPVIKVLESGKVPKDSFETIRRLETYLGIDIHDHDLEADKGFKEKKESYEFFSEFGRSKENKKIEVPKPNEPDFEPSDDFKFDSMTSREITVGDLKEMKTEKEKGRGFGFFRRKKEED